MDWRGGEMVRLDSERLAEKPGPHVMSYGFDLDLLCRSVERVGLINPPWVARNRKGSFEIVSGYRRLRALKALGKRDVLCNDVTPLLRSPMERFLAGFYENLATRKFNEIEKAMILTQLEGYAGRKEILTRFMPLVALPSHEDTLKFYLNLLDLEERDRLAVARGQISVAAIKAVVDMEKADRQILLDWINDFNLNFNQQLKFIDCVNDICRRDELRATELLSDQVFTEIAESGRLNKPQKAKAVLDALRIRRSPRLAEAQQTVAAEVAAIALPEEAAMLYDPYLEDPCYRLEIRFRHGRELKKTIEKLHGLRALEGIRELWTGK
jgi:ParB family chromosome partitioning protein